MFHIISLSSKRRIFNKVLLTVLLTFFFLPSAHALKADIQLPESFNLPDNSKCLVAFACLKKGETSVLSYDDKVWGNPKFLPVDIVTLDGAELKGKAALFATSTGWKFVKDFMFFIPEGETIAYYIGGKEALTIAQQGKKALKIYDAYGNSYLERLVSGPLRLSFNPEAGTTKKFNEFVAPTLIDDARKRVAGEVVKERLKSGKSLSQSVEAAQSADSILTGISTIEITQKEYLLYDEKAKSTVAITKANAAIILGEYFAKCSAVSEKEAKPLIKKYKKIVDAVTLLNEKCS